MSGYKLKLGMIFVGCLLLFLAGCTHGYDQQTDPVDERTQEASNEGNNIIETDEGEVFVVRELLEENGIKMAHLIPIDEAGALLESAPPLFMAFEGVSIEIEDGGDSTRRGATSEDIVEGDVLRLYMSGHESASDSAGTMEASILEKIVIIRQVD